MSFFCPCLLLAFSVFAFYLKTLTVPLLCGFFIPFCFCLGGEYIYRGARHPNVVQFMGVIMHSSGRYIVTEFVEGGALRDVLRKKREFKLEWPLRVRIATDIARAMAYLHSRSIIHRDLKSANVLMDGSLRAKVADLGLARSFSRQGQQTATSVVGTLEWMAPELLKGQKYNEKADVFSYGLILFEIIIRKKPEADLFRQHDFSANTKAIEEQVPKDCPEALSALMLACLKANPALRPSFEVILEVLENAGLPKPLPVIELLRIATANAARKSVGSHMSTDYYSDSSNSTGPSQNSRRRASRESKDTMTTTDTVDTVDTVGSNERSGSIGVGRTVTSAVRRSSKQGKSSGLKFARGVTPLMAPPMRKEDPSSMVTERPRRRSSGERADLLTPTDDYSFEDEGGYQLRIKKLPSKKKGR